MSSDPLHSSPKRSLFHLVSHRSPPVVHHFSLLNELKKLVIGEIELKTAVQDIFHPKHKHVKDLPIIYEGAGKKKIMEVGRSDC